LGSVRRTCGIRVSFDIERERELIRQSNLELELEELEEKHIREMRKERPTSLSVQNLDP
jgi:hypothetical protein